MEKIINQLIEILSQELELENVTKDTLLDTIGLTSYNFIKVVIRIEEAFDIEFADEYLSMDNFKVIEDIAKYIVAQKED